MKPRRTHQTALTDDELVLLDALFDKHVYFEHLQADGFHDTFFLGYTHGLSDDHLQRTLDRWVAEAILRTYPHTEGLRPVSKLWGRTKYALTAAGGRLWELERQPKWDRYCTDSYWKDEETGEWWIAVESPSQATARAFLEVPTRCGEESYDLDRATTVTRGGDSLLSWKTFPKVYEVRAPESAEGIFGGYDPEYDHPNNRARRRECVEDARTWWRDAAELDSLRG